MENYLFLFVLIARSISKLEVFIKRRDKIFTLRLNVKIKWW